METPRTKPVHARAVRPKRALPTSVDKMLRWPVIAALEAEYGRAPVVEALRGAAEAVRMEAVGGGQDEIAAYCKAALLSRVALSQRRVFNLTGTVLHTNLGRALIAEEAIAAAVEAMRSPTTLEYELDQGKRGERDRHIERWLTELSGAEAVSAVNNNAAAVLLTLSTLAKGRQVIVSRGELVEIGGSFRIPDIMREAGCRLIEVGTTNRTHLADYERAIGADSLRRNSAPCPCRLSAALPMAASGSTCVVWSSRTKCCSRSSSRPCLVDGSWR